MIFDFCISFCGDALDRFILRLFDMRNSFLIVKHILVFFAFCCFLNLFDLFVCENSIETIIYMFYMVWLISIPGIALASIEAPKGEYCVCISLFYFVITRARIRCADFLHILCIDFMCRGFLIADLVTLIGNLDVVFGSVDR